MDDQRFDRVAIQLGRVMTRRHMGSLLAMLGLGASSGSTPEATAKNKNNKNKKKKQKPKKPPSCTPLCVGQACGDPDGCGGACQDGFCPGTQICDDGVCKDDCPSPQKLCSGGCVALDTNSNCGDCDIACPEHASCTDGQCVCNDGARPCGDECIADANCCTDEAPGCPHDRTCCLEGEQGVCRNTNADENNCGGCGPVFACDGDHQCVDGDCQPICAPGMRDWPHVHRGPAIRRRDLHLHNARTMSRGTEPGRRGLHLRERQQWGQDLPLHYDELVREPRARGGHALRPWRAVLQLLHESVLPGRVCGESGLHELHLHPPTGRFLLAAVLLQAKLGAVHQWWNGELL